MATDWHRRLEAMQYAGESTLYVTHAEWQEMMELGRPRLMAGSLAGFAGTPVRIDGAEAAAQIERTGADMTAGEFAMHQHGITSPRAAG